MNRYEAIGFLFDRFNAMRGSESWLIGLEAIAFLISPPDRSRRIFFELDPWQEAELRERIAQGPGDLVWMPLDEPVKDARPFFEFSHTHQAHDPKGPWFPIVNGVVTMRYVCRQVTPGEETSNNLTGGTNG